MQSAVHMMDDIKKKETSVVGARTVPGNIHDTHNLYLQVKNMNNFTIL